MNKLIIGLVLLMAASAYGGLTISGSPAPNITAGNVSAVNATSTTLNVSSTVIAPDINRSGSINKNVSEGFNHWRETIGMASLVVDTAHVVGINDAGRITGMAYLGNGEVLVVTGKDGSTNGCPSKSYDYGVTWSLGNAIAQNLQGVVYMGKGVCITVGQTNNLDYVGRSTDRGLTWTQVGTNVFTNTYMGSVENLGNGIVIASSTNGNTGRSIDSGSTWAYVTNFVEGSPRFMSGDQDTVIASISHSTISIYKSTDWGANWYSVTNMALGGMDQGVHMGVTADGGCYVGQQAFIQGCYAYITIKSFDNGSTWSSYTDSINHVTWSIVNAGGGVLFRIGQQYGSNYTGTTYYQKSVDFGTTWTTVYSVEKIPMHCGIVMENGVVLFGGGGRVSGDYNRTVYFTEVLGRPTILSLGKINVSPAASFGKAYVDGGGTNWYRCTNGTTWNAW